MSNESLSALIDGECSDAELDRLLASMDSDPELGRRWSRLQLQRESAEGTRVARGQACICAGVMAALDEPVGGARVVDMSAWRRRLATLPWKPAAGFAAAASMGAAAVLFLGPQTATTDVRGPAATSSAGNMRVSNPVGNSFGNNLSLPGSRGTGRLRSVSLTGDNPGPTFADDEYAALLRDYVASRNAAAAAAEVNGPRYARFDSAEAPR